MHKIQSVGGYALHLDESQPHKHSSNWQLVHAIIVVNVADKLAKMHIAVVVIPICKLPCNC